MTASTVPDLPGNTWNQKSGEPLGLLTALKELIPNYYLSEKGSASQADCKHERARQEIDHDQDDPPDHDCHDGWYPVQVQCFFHRDEPGNYGQYPTDKYHRSSDAG
jgi:hypothetical protein